MFRSRGQKFPFLGKAGCRMTNEQIRASSRVVGGYGEKNPAREKQKCINQ